MMKREDNKALEQHFQQALEQQRAGNLAAAQRKCRSILQKAPNHGKTLQLLAILMQQSGNSRAALHFMQKALEFEPDNPQLLRNMAEIERARDNPDEAQRYAQLALSQAPNDVDALFVSGAIFVQQGDRHRAMQQFARVVAVNPDDVEAHNELGNLMCASGEYDGAIEHYRHALERHPEFRDCRINLAVTLLETGAGAQAITEFRKLLEDDSNDARLHHQLGRAFELDGDREQAASCFELALRQDPLLLAARIDLGRLMLERDPHQAENWFKSVLDIDPKHAPGYYWLGVLFQSLGKFERASNYLQQACRIDPDFTQAWYRLSLDRSFSISEQQLDTLERQYRRRANDAENEEALIALGFALGRFHDQAENHAAAFQSFAHANHIKAARQAFDPALHRTQVERVIATFDRKFFNRRSGWGVDSDLPVFIIGMPRSGTTLVEQILSAHPQVHGAGERRAMLELSLTLAPGDPDQPQSHSARVAALERGKVRELALQQFEELRRLAPRASHVVDKLPGNYFRLGLIHLLFPQAIVIHCRRDPMDTCWSCFQQNFESGLHFCNDLENLAEAYLGYRQLMEHWRRLFPDQIFEIDYEVLVQNAESASRKLLQFCGLPWDPQILEFQRLERPVNTASIWQVRQPIYRSSVGRWQAYREYLEPLRRRLDATY